MRTSAFTSTMAARSRTRMREPNTGGSAPEGLQQPQSRQVSVAGEVPQSVAGSAADDECQESPLDTTLTPEGESDPLSCKASSTEPRSGCSLVTSSRCVSEDDMNVSCTNVTGGSPTNDNQNKQSAESNEVGQGSEASGEVTSQLAIHDVQYTETAAVGSERRYVKAVRKLRESSRKSSSSSSSGGISNSRSSSESRGADSRSRAHSGSGADGDNDDTDTSRSGASSVDLVELYDDTVEWLEVEKQNEEYIIGAIGSCMESASSMSSDIREFALEVFGRTRLTGEPSRKCSGGRKKGKRSDVEEGEARGPNDDFDRRLEAVKAYLASESAGSEMIAEARAEMEEEASSAPVPEEGACSSIPSKAKQEAESSSSGASAKCSEDAAAAVVGGNDECERKTADADRQQSYHESLRKRRAARKSWENSTVAKICAIVEQRVLKAKVSCLMMLNCMKPVADIVHLAKEAYEVTEVAMQKAKTCKSASAGDILKEITAAASETAAWMWKALCDAETAVRIYAGIVEAIKKTERSLYAVPLEGTVDDGVMRDVTAAVDDIEMLIERTAVFRLDVPQREEQAAPRTCITPPPGSGDVEARAFLSTNDTGGTERVPADVLQALLAATRSCLNAVNATVRALEFFATCKMCVGSNFRKNRGCGQKPRK